MSAEQDGLDDEALMEMLAQGDGDAADALVERYRNALFAFLYRMNENRADAEDLFQKTWLSVVSYRRMYRPGSRFSTWLFQIALNCTRDLASSKRPTSSLEEDPEDPGNAPNAETEAESRESTQDLVRKLPLPWREAVILRYFHGMKESEIAEVSGIPSPWQPPRWLPSLFSWPCSISTTWR